MFEAIAAQSFPWPFDEYTGVRSLDRDLNHGKCSIAYPVDIFRALPASTKTSHTGVRISRGLPLKAKGRLSGGKFMATTPAGSEFIVGLGWTLE